ncbi:heavy-metal-associated domain-containing protein [Schleiferia thermophila]|uniref:Copper chaperone CopZ n=1 Tax=Schleiferia thermophila TaxID=884107 RepID=A0A369A7F3_9FLAO|nr:heavy metal-associated domain-containing protein [Schleiferia thermophila]RCX05083.1 copper chaperone CopZ [Schleiferia thermophila]
MKTSTLLLLLALLLGSCTFNSSQKETSAADVTAVANTSAELEIRGMTCEVGCKKLIEKTVRKTAGITKFDIDFEHNSAHMEYDSTMVSADDVVKIINTINNGAYTAIVHDVAAL